MVIFYRVDYKMHPVEKPQKRQGEVYRQPEGDLDLRTSYAQQYTRTYSLSIYWHMDISVYITVQFGDFTKSQCCRPALS